MALALEACVTPSSNMRVGDWIQRLAGEVLALRARSVAQIENDSGNGKLEPVLSERPPPEGATPAPRALQPQLPIAAGDRPTLSQVPSISVSTSALHDRIVSPWRRPRIVFPAVAVGAAAIVAIFLAGMSPRTGRAPEAAAAAPPRGAAAPSSPPSIPPPRPEAELAAAPAPPPASAGAQGATAPCVVRAFVDESGIKHYVKECK